ncbi:hypothetical protein [Microbacterium sp. NPDC089695]|uniref:hypothetical protein n=1 Tax=Microbacterium sp. NPDC089695 TaxID=3364198 RepID=UPI00380A4333
MTLNYIAGTLPRMGVYAIGFGTLSRVPSGSWDLNASTVESVEMVGAGREYNYAKGGVGIFAGAAFAGPVGAVVGGLLPKAFKDDVVQFVIRFRNGDVAHFSGSPGDYRRALQASYKGMVPSASAPSQPVERTPAEEEALIRSQLAAEPIERRPKDNPDAERLRAEIAADKQAARRSIEDVRAEMAAEREARDAAGDPLDGNCRLWFAGAVERKYVTAAPNETPAERKQREAQNEQHRKEYKKALAVVRKTHEKQISDSKMSFKEKMRLLSEIQKEFSYRTSK